MTIADSSRTSSSNNEQHPMMRLSWQVAGRTAAQPPTEIDRRPTEGCRLLVQVDPTEIADTGLLRAWLDVAGTEHELLAEQHSPARRDVVRPSLRLKR